MMPRVLMAAASAALLLGFPSLPARAQQSCPPPTSLPAAEGANLFPGQKEIDLGDVIAEREQAGFRVIEDDALNSYLNEMARRLLAAMPNPTAKVEVRLIDKPYVNAFSMPGGRIYLTRKIVAFVSSEDELAGLLSHELGHELAHHGAVEFSYLFQRILGIRDVGNRQDIFEKYNLLLENLRRDPKAFAKLAEREEPDQYQADQIALTAMANAGYDPQAFLQFFDRLAQTRGKTGSWLSDALGTTKPNEKRLRVMQRAYAGLPAGCRTAAPAASPTLSASASTQKFQEWQAAVIAYSGLGRREVLHALIAKKTLQPPLRVELTRLRFSPDGRYLLAQDDAGIYVATREPLRVLFRIDAPDVATSDFTPDSENVVLHTYGHRVEWWSVADQERIAMKELAFPGGCLQSSLSPDGKTYACLSSSLRLSLVDVDSGAPIFVKEKVFEPVGMGTAQFLGLSAWIDMPGVYAHWASMGFSLDGRYFLASRHDEVVAYDTAERREIQLHGPLRASLGGGFAFLEGGRIFGERLEINFDSVLATFPGGEALSKLRLPRYQMEGASHGNYLLLQRVKEAALVILDLDTRAVVLSSQKSTTGDVYGDFFVTERGSGEVGLYSHDVKLLQQITLPAGPLPPVHAWAVSPDLHWLAVSGRHRGALWDINLNERVFYLRSFSSAWFDGKGTFYADFPKEGDLERSIMRADVGARSMAMVRAVPDDTDIRGFGRLRFVRRPAGNDKSAWKNIVLEVRDIRDDSLLWSRAFPREAPVIHVHPNEDSAVFDWSLGSEAAKDELKGNAALAAQAARMKDAQAGRLFVAVQASTGAPLGGMALDTGKGSVRVKTAMALGGRLLLTDSANRTLVYSLATGEPSAKTFGKCLAVSAAANLMAVENEPGELFLFDLDSLEKRQQLDFSHDISVAQFSADGGRLLVLTKDQTAYFFDSSEMQKAPASKASR